MKNKTRNFELILTSISLIISIRVLYIENTILNMERKEELVITAESKEFGTLNYIYDDEKNLLEYTMDISMYFSNNSKLPIYIERGEVTKLYYYENPDSLDSVVVFPVDLHDNIFHGDECVHSEIEELDFPIYIGPQGIKKIDCKIRIQIPERITQYILEEFTDVDKLDIYEIDDFLFSNKHFDIQGNYIDTYMKRGEVKYKYNYSPFYLDFYSARGNCYSTYYFAESYISSKVDKIKYFK